MSVRIHAIAKEIKKTSKEVLDILAERGYELKSASSTIDNITAESLIEEFKSDDDVSTDPESSDSKNSASETQSDTKPSKIPLVKSKEDIEREKKGERGSGTGRKRKTGTYKISFRRRGTRSRGTRTGQTNYGPAASSLYQSECASSTSFGRKTSGAATTCFRRY